MKSIWTLHFGIKILATPLILKNVHIKNVLFFLRIFTRYSESETIYLCNVNMWFPDLPLSILSF